MAKYLVTGGAGFIGSHIVEEILARGEEVRVIDNLSTGNIKNLESFLEKIEFIEGDITNPQDVRKAVIGIDYVVHQAAYLNVAGSVENPGLANDINVGGTLNILTYSKEADVKRVVFASSCSVYGDSEENPKREDSSVNPVSPYAASKLAGEYYLKMFSKVYGLETVILRYFNVYGPKQSLASKYASVIPAFIERFKKDLPCIIDSDGKQSRDFVFVKDVARANISACHKEGISGEVFNVGLGKDISIIDLFNEMSNIVGKKIEPEYGEIRPGDVKRVVADMSKTEKLLGLTMRKDFSSGLKDTVEWFLSRL